MYNLHIHRDHHHLGWGGDHETLGHRTIYAYLDSP